MLRGLCRPRPVKACWVPQSQPSHLTRGYNTSEDATFPTPLSDSQNWCWPVDWKVSPARLQRLITSQRDWLETFPFQQFHVLFNSLFKVLFIFPSRYLFAIGLSPIFSFRWNLPPYLSCIPKQLDSSRVHHRSAGSPCQRRDSHPLWRSIPRDLYTVQHGKHFSRLQLGQLRELPDFKFELFPLHSQLLGESLLVSFPPLIDMLKFSG